MPCAYRAAKTPCSWQTFPRIQTPQQLEFRREISRYGSGICQNQQRNHRGKRSQITCPYHHIRNGYFRVRLQCRQVAVLSLRANEKGYLYNFAKQLGCNKIALGHHYDDVIETILMGMLHGAQIQTMMPKLHSTNFDGMELIRPLYLIREDDIKAWRDYNDLHFIQCACRFTDTCTSCNNGQNHSKRQETKLLIRELKRVTPTLKSVSLRA